MKLFIVKLQETNTRAIFTTSKVWEYLTIKFLLKVMHFTALCSLIKKRKGVARVCSTWCVTFLLFKRVYMFPFIKLFGIYCTINTLMYLKHRFSLLLYQKISIRLSRKSWKSDNQAICVISKHNLIYLNPIHFSFFLVYNTYAFMMKQKQKKRI